MISEIFNIQFFHPSIFYILGGLLIPVLRGKVKQGYMLTVSGFQLIFLARNLNHHS